MSSTPRSLRKVPLVYLVLAIAAAVILLAGLNLLGWAIANPTLRSLGSGPETMKANTALGFLLCAGALALLALPAPSRRVRFIGMLASSFAVLLGGLTLAQYAFGLDLGLDQALFTDSDLLTPPPGRMAPNTAVAITLIGLALLVKTLRPGRVRVRQFVLVAALAVLALALLSAIGNITKFSAGRQWGQATAMTLPAAAGLALLGIGLIAILRIRGDLRWHLSTTQTSALVAGVVALFFVAEVSWEAIARLQATNRRLARVAETRYLLSEILSTAQDHESSFRRHFIAGQAAARSESTAARAHELRARLQALLVAPADHALLEEVVALQANLRGFEERLRVIFTRDGLAAVTEIIKGGEGMRLMDAIRVRIADLQAGQAATLARLDAEADHWSRATAIALPLGALLAVVTIVLALASLNAEAGRRRAGETRFRGIFDSAFQFIGLLTPDGTLIEANQTALQFGGLAPEEVINRPFWEATWWRLRPDIPARLRAAISRAAQGELVRYEEDVQGAGGRVATIDFSLKPVRDDEGRIVYLVPEGRDITDNKRAARALAESEARWNFALTGSDLGVWDWNAATDEVFFSERWCTMLGYAPADIAPRLDEWSSRVHPDDWSVVQAAIREHFEGRTAAYVSEHRVRKKDGSWCWIMDRGQAIERAADGRPLRVIGTHTDITAQKVAETDARRLQEQLSGILRFSPNLITLIDRDGRYLLAGHRVAEALGRPVSEVVGRSLHEVLAPDVADVFAARIARMNADPVPFEVEDVVPGPAGDRIFQTHLFPLIDAQGRHYATGGIAGDVTESRQALVTVQRSLAEREVLLREIHHRVKNNLQIISSLLNLQARALPDPAHRQPFEECRQRVASMSLIHDQLYRHADLARIDFAGYAETLVRLQRVAAGIPAARVAIHVEVTVPPIDIATAVPCGLIVSELISNACKHGFPAPRSGMIALRLIDCGTCWELSVSDDGVGDAAVPPERGGGLGLQLIAALVRQLHGDIDTCTSPAGHRVTIRFPAPSSFP